MLSIHCESLNMRPEVNSTIIANRIFRTQRIMVLTIVSVLVLFLIITSVTAYRKIEYAEAYSKALEKVNNYYKSSKLKFQDTKSNS